MKHISIFTGMLIIFLLIVLLVGTVYYFFILKNLREDMEIAERKIQSRTVVYLSQQIQDYMEHYRQTFKDFETLALERLAHRQSLGTLRNNPLLKKRIDRDKNLKALFILDASGEGAQFLSVQLGAPILEEVRGIFGKLQKESSVFGKAIYVDTLGDTLLPFGIALKEGSNFKGSIIALLSLNPIFERLPTQEEGMETFVVDQDGKVIIHSKTSLNVEKPSYKDVSIVQQFKSAPDPITLIYPFHRGIETIKVLGTIKNTDVLGLQWRVVVQRDAKVALAGVTQAVKQSAIIGAVVLLLIMIFGYGFARILATPLTQIAFSTQKIAQGNFNERVTPQGTKEIHLLTTNFNLMADHVASYISQLQHALRENKQLFINAIRMISSAVDAKDPYTQGHTERVRRYSVIIAKTYGFSPVQVEEVNISALLHDVGKIGVDDRVLRKPSTLSDDEFAMIKSHVTKGADILNPIPQLQNIIPGVKYHHENWGGGGYPEGLKGEQIPLIARIIAVADTFDAMTTDRPYQKAMSFKYAAEKIRSMAGKRFDPKVVEAFLKAFEKGDLFNEELAKVA